MNGTPGQVMIALGISSKFNLEQVEDLYEGISLACKNTRSIWQEEILPVR